MNKNEYMKQLAHQLRRLPKEDYDRAMDYFYEYFDDAGVENEQQAIEDLGSPQAAADQIVQDIAQETLDSTETTPTVKRGLSTVWLVILAIFASPIALPLALAFIMVLLSLVLVAFSLVLCVVFTALAVFLAGIMGAVCGIWLLFSSPADGIAIIGASLILLGLSVLVSIASVKIARWLGKWLRKFMQKTIKGGKKHEKLA